MGLFDKKSCDICGEKIKLFARKVEDGNLCKECTKKLSPWFSERKKSTVADIRAQLEYREANKEAVKNFNVTRTIGDNYKVLLDENAKKFLVTNARKWQDENPDVLDFGMVTGVTLNTEEHKHEEKRKTADGKEVSYNPPVYDYSYDFDCTIHVNHPYFDEMTFRLNDREVHTGQTGYVQPARGNVSINAGNGLAGAIAAGITGAMANNTMQAGTVANPEIQMYQDMANEIKMTLLQARQDVRQEEMAANAPKQAVQCPNCGATTIPDANGCCEYCGGAVG
ncbi:MAG: DUF4428 domain-containing protein [Lachnospiraceae bacterium]|jgi:ribosomal protein L32|nr:DUF4428 domain-containing protein [Lachnospiraceae bacterium]